MKFKSIPSPDKWLNGILQKHKVVQRKLAKLICCNVTQLNKWVNGKEHVPIYQLESICHSLCLPRDEVEYATLLVLCHDRVEDIKKFLDKVPDDILPISTNFLLDVIVDVSERLLLKHAQISSNQQLHLLNSYLADGLLAARCVTAEYGEILTPQNVLTHLQYPFNYFFGEFIEKFSGSEYNNQRFKLFSANVLDCFRSSAKLIGRNNKNMSFKDQLCYQHAIHMLSRYGQVEDKNYTQDIVNSNNIFEKRMVLSGIIFSSGSTEYQSKYVYEMDRNMYFARASILFDAVHYRDARIDGSRFPDKTSSYDNTIISILNSIDRDSQYNELNLRKLIQIAREDGSSIFFRKNIISNRIKKLLIILTQDSTKTSKIKKDFLETFSFLIN